METIKFMMISGSWNRREREREQRECSASIWKLYIKFMMISGSWNRRERERERENKESARHQYGNYI